MGSVPDPNWFGEFWAVHHRWPTDEEVREQMSEALPEGATEDSGIRSYLRDDIRDDHIEALHWHNSPGPL